MRRSLEELWLRLIRLYTFNTPIDKGKYRLFSSALKFCKFDHDALAATATDGRRFIANLSTGMHDQLYFLGQYENAISKIATQLINKGDVCVDAGANFGWYTTLMAKLCGPSGSVHSFEPVPKTFRELETNVGLSGFKNVSLNNNALGDRRDTIVIRIPRGEPTGHASISSRSEGADDAFECEMFTLDDYLTAKAIERVNFVKVDIEGAEMMFLRGASRLFEQPVPPVFLMEMALKQSRHFGYLPDDLIKLIGAKGDYLFFAVNESSCTLSEIDGFADDDIGANVFCIPRAVSIDTIREKIKN